MAFHKPSFNAQFIGNVGRTPELRYTNSERPVVNISLAINDDYKDQDGNKVERTIWVRATAWGRTAEVLAQHVKKGDRMLFAGKPYSEAWVKKNDGQTALDAEGNPIIDTRTCLTISSFEFLGSANGAGSGQQSQAPEPVEEDDIPF